MPVCLVVWLSLPGCLVVVEALQGSNPYSNLESYMNWEKDAWNTRGWTIAQGEGLFKHADANNFGGGHGDD